MDMNTLESMWWRTVRSSRASVPTALTGRAGWVRWSNHLSKMICSLSSSALILCSPTNHPLPWLFEWWRQTAGRYASTIHIGFLSYGFRDQCLPLWWICPEQRKNRIVGWSMAKRTPSPWKFSIAFSHRFLIVDGLALGFYDKRNLI